LLAKGQHALAARNHAEALKWLSLAGRAILWQKYKDDEYLEHVAHGLLEIPPPTSSLPTTS